MRLFASAMLIAACTAMLAPIQAHAQPRTEVAGLAHVIDGDTLHLTTPDAGKVVKVRLQGVAAPERSDAGGSEATQFVGQLAEGRQVRCELDGSRSKDRVVGVCFVDAAGGGKDIGAAVIEAGRTARGSQEVATRPWNGRKRLACRTRRIACRGRSRQPAPARRQQRQNHWIALPWPSTAGPRMWPHKSPRKLRTSWGTAGG